MGGMDLLGQRDNRCVVGDIGSAGVQNRAVRRDDLLLHARQTLGVDVGQDHLGAARRGGQRRRATDPARRTGDEAALAPDVLDGHGRPMRRAARRSSG
ncbi:MAG TPA: hypothetical protein VFY45_14485 [Baekduia sp.]|nr:hypothetical protein [Baekduia sp.]